MLDKLMAKKRKELMVLKRKIQILETIKVVLKAMQSLAWLSCETEEVKDEEVARVQVGWQPCHLIVASPSDEHS